SHIEPGTGPVTIVNNEKTEEPHMKMKLFLSTVSLALVIGGGSGMAQSIAIGHLADYSGGTSDVGTPYGQAVADTFAWVNKNGGIGGKQLSVDTNDYGYQ